MRTREPRMIVWRMGKFRLKTDAASCVVHPAWTRVGVKEVASLFALVALWVAAKAWGAVTGQRISWH